MFLIAALVICFTLPQLAEPRFQVENKIRSLLHRYDLTSRADAYEIRQIMTQDPSTSRTLMWQSQDEDNRALAEIRKKGEKASQVVPATSSVFTDNGVTRHLHTVMVTGLTPGTSYEYRVGNDRKRSLDALKRRHRALFRRLSFPIPSPLITAAGEPLLKRPLKTILTCPFCEYGGPCG